MIKNIKKTVFLFLLFFCFKIFVYSEVESLFVRSFDGYYIKIDLDLKFIDKNEKNYCCIFVNDLDQDKDKWIPFIKELDDRFSICTYNLRGDMDETHKRYNRKLYNSKKKKGYYALNEHIRDLRAIVDFLDFNYNIKKENIILFGSRFGSSIVLNYASGVYDINQMLLISPRKDIKGNSIKSSIKVYGKRPLMMVTSIMDIDSNDVCMDYMATLSRNVNLNIKFYKENFTGLEFLQYEEIIKDIINWLEFTSK